ncbi:MAG TPA: hypothetical protein DEB39_11020 [Planctomycetaceae bacterium]|nr:hypothetical protein [Planctomycetaceae bacterium]
MFPAKNRLWQPSEIRFVVLIICYTNETGKWFKLFAEDSMTVHFVTFRGKPALAAHYYDWSLVMPIKGRKPSTAFKIGYRFLREIPNTAEGKVIVKILPKKGIGQIRWIESCGWRATHPFVFSLADHNAKGAPSESDHLNEYPVSLLDEIWRCAKPCLKTYSPSLSCVHVTPGGELRASDGKYAFGIQTPFTFDAGEKSLIRSCELFGKKYLRREKSFRMGFAENTVHFDFGLFHFFSKPNVERYPDLNKVFSSDDTTQTRLTLDPKDAAFLKKHLDELPGRKDRDSPVTLLCEYDGTISAHGETPRSDETKAVLLVRSKYEGDAYVLRMNRNHLRQALSLGCLDFRFGTSYPFASTENIRICWMPLDTCGALPLESECPRNPVVLLRSDQPSTKKEQK